MLGKTRPVGVLQLYNRVASEILQDDLVRLHYIRKLIGSMMVKCEMYSITLQLTVGMAQAMDSQQRIKDSVSQLSYGHMLSLQQSVLSMQRRLDGGDENASSQGQTTNGFGEDPSRVVD